MPINIKLSSSPSGTRNISFNPVVAATESHVFAMDPSDPTQYHVPGNGSPAVSTSQYYLSSGMYNFRPYDLDQMGSAGAAVKAANGGKRYVWVCSADHPSLGYAWRGGDDFLVGFSRQWWDFPKKMDSIIGLNESGGFNTPHHTISGGYTTYEFPLISYNPDDADGLPIYLMAEATDHQTMLWRTADFSTWTVKESSHFNTTTGWSSFASYVRRNGVGDFTSIALSRIGGSGATAICFSVWNSTDGIEYTTSSAAIAGMPGSADAAGSTYYPDCIFKIGSQYYNCGREDAADGSQHSTLYPLDGNTFDKQSSPAKMRVASGGWVGSGFPGPTFLQQCPGYYEDGLLLTLPTYGFPSSVTTTAGNAGRGGAPYLYGGGLAHQFIDKVAVRVDDNSARLAAPVGVSVSCASSTVTVSWKNALPQNTYRLYRGTDATTQSTLIGDYSGVTSATDSPSTGRYWYKLVTLDNGTERKSVVLPVYASSSSAFVNEHIDRVLDDGADSSTINRAFLDRADAMLDSVGIRSLLELFTHPACGVAQSATVISKVYDLGTTRLPRSEDFKTTTSATTYSATSVNGGPGWTNANNNSYGYWGNLRRGNTIQKKRQITIIAAYERTQTTEDFTFVGTGPIWGSASDGSAIITLKHTAGTPGNIQFSLSDETSTKTASVAASGSGMQIAIGTYDGTNMLAYTGSTAGSAVSTLSPNAEFGTNGTPGYTNGSLAGSRNYLANGGNGDVGASPFPNFIPILGSGSVHSYTLRARSGGNGTGTNTLTFSETNAKGKIQCIMVLEGAINSTQIGNVISFLQSTTNW